MNKIFTEAYSYIALPTIVIILIAHISAFYAVIRFVNQCPFFVYLTFPIIAIGYAIFETVAFTWGAKLLEASQAQIWSVKILYKVNANEISRQFSSIQPLKISIGHYFAITKTTLFTFSKVVIENTITALFIK